MLNASIPGEYTGKMEYKINLDLDEMFKNAPQTNIEEEVRAEINTKYDRPISARENLGSLANWDGLLGKVFGYETN